MDLIILPRPKRMDEGPGRWFPASALSGYLEKARFAMATPEGIEFSENEIEDAIGAYNLSAGSGGIHIEASSPEGRWNAIQTLRQVLRQCRDDGSLPELFIEDAPAFPIRGVMLDVSRCRVPTMEMLYQLIDIWTELKINQVQLYIEHTFAYTGHEAVWKEASAFTGDEIEDIDEYCRERGIELVPNQNSFGHMERWLCHSEYHHLAESPEGFEDPWGVFREQASTLDMEKPESMDFLRNLYDQYLPHFSSRTFNLGGDEPYELGKGTNRKLCKEKGIGTLYLEHLNRIVNEVEKRGYVPQFWADIILNYPELLDKVPRNALVMNWGYEADHPFEKETTILGASGRKFQVCPGTSSWNTLAGRWTNARENIRSAAKWGLKNGAEGCLITDWGDNGHKQQYVTSLPGWFIGAAADWNGADGVDEDVTAALQQHVFGKPEGTEAAWLLKLGDLYLENPVKLHNMSFLMVPLLDHEYPYYRQQYREIAESGMGRSREISAEACTALGGTDGDTWRRQLSFTAGVISFAADLAEPFYASGDYSIEGLPESVRESLANRLEKLMTSYEELWKEYCRPGGLEESLGGFARLLELLRT